MSDIYGSYVSVTSSHTTRKWRAWLNYSISTSETTVSYSASGRMDLSGGSGTTAKFQKNGATGKLYIDGSNVKSYTNSGGAVSVNAANDWTMLSHSASWSRGTSNGSHTSYWTITTAKGSWAGTSTTSAITISVPAKSHWTVSYNANGGSGSIASQTKWYGTNLTLSNGSGFSRTGYTLSKWNTNSAGTGTSYNLSATYTENAALTLYAIWTENTATLSFNANGHGTAPSSETMRYTQAAKAPSIGAVPGYTFMGWNTQADGSGVGYIVGSTVKQANVIPANTVLYAQWKLNFPIQAKVNNAWASGTPYIKVNGTWKTTDRAYLKLGNKWQNLAYKSNDNLLLDSRMDDRSTFVTASDADFSKPLRWYNGDASIHNFQLIGNDVYKDVVTLNSAANLGIAFARLASDINLDPNSYYTLSCYASCTQSGAHLDIGLSYYTTADAWVWRGGSNPQYFSAVNTVQRFALTFKPDANTKGIMYCFTVVGASGGTNTFTIYNCKLEKGVVVTDWMPAPEES